MGKLRMMWSRVMGQAAQGREDATFDEEVREHIALLERRYRAQGMGAQEATRAARRQFGNITVLKNGSRRNAAFFLQRSGLAMRNLECECWPSGRH